MLLKRIFDILLAIIGLILGGWLILLGWLICYLDTGENGFFFQRRVGQHGRIFHIIKLRTMNSGVSENPVFTSNNKLSNTGRFLRKSKLDELPQLINVLIGDMSFVGPRPDVEGFADLLEGEDRKILLLKPGITGPASLKFADEDNILMMQKDPIKYNSEVIYPEKTKINLWYFYNRNFIYDIKILLSTLGRLFN